MSEYNQNRPSSRSRDFPRYNPRQSFSSQSTSHRRKDFAEGLLPSVLATLHVPDITTFDAYSPTAEISDVNCIGSYSWFGEEGRSIIVPASPPEWTYKPTPFALPPDTAGRFIDQNGHRIPSSPLLPLITAVDTFQATVAGGCNPFHWSSVNIVTDRNGLRKLVRWIKGGGNARDFRIDLQLAGNNTVLFTRWEQITKEKPKHANLNSFGHNFEDATTKRAKGCEEASGHHRIVQYDFGGLKMVIRFEVDACIPAAAPNEGLRDSELPVEATVSTNPTLDDVVSAMSNASISTATRSSQTVSSGKTALKIYKTDATLTSQKAIAELKTISRRRFAKGGYDWKDVALQMLLSQTPHMFIGIHDGGNFQEVKQRSFDSSIELQRAEKSVGPALMKLRKILEDIRKLVIEHGARGRLSLVCKSRELKVYQRQSSVSCLPDDVLRKFL